MTTIADNALVGRRWKDLKIEEQMRVRILMRNGRVRIEGEGADRRVVWTLRALTMMT